MEDFEKKMIDRTGQCKFCNQIRVIRVPECFNTERIDDEVTSVCDCPQAEAEKAVQDIIASAEMQIKDFFEERNMDLFRDVLLALVEPMARKQLDRISFKAGKYQISMKRKTASIEVGIKVVTEEKVES